MHRYITSRIFTKSFLFATLLIPLIITPFTVYPFVFGKVLVLYVLIEAALASFLTYVILHPALALEELKARFKNIRLPLFIIVLIYLGVMFVTSYLSNQPSIAFWGLPQQNDGLFLHLHLFVLSILTALVFDKKDWKLYANGLLFCTGLVMMFAWYQYSGAGERTKIASFVGNPAYLGAFLLFSIAIVHVMLGYLNNGNHKRWYWVILGLIVVTTLLTGIRALLLGVGVGVVVVLVLSIFSRSHKNVRFILVAATLLLATFTGIFWQTRSAELWKKVPVLKRLAVLNVNSASLVERQSAWDAGIRAFKTHPIRGFGQNSGEQIFYSYGSIKNSCYSDAWYINLHNKFIEVVTSSGLFGLMLYISLLGYLLFVYRKNFVFVLFFVAYIIQNLFLFDTPLTYILFAILLGFSLTSTPFEELSRNATTIAHNSKVARYAKIVAIVLLLGLINIFIFGVVRIYMQQRDFGALFKAKNDAEFISHIQNIVEYSGNSNTPARMITESNILALMRETKAMKSGVGKQLMLKVAQHLEELYSTTYFHLPVLEELAYSYLELGKEALLKPSIISGVPENPQNYFEKAESFALRMIAASPQMVRFKYLLIEIYVAENKYDEALALAQKTLSIDEKSSRSQLYFAFATTKQSDRPTEAGKREVEKALILASSPVCYADQNDQTSILNSNFKLFVAEDFIVLLDLIRQYNLQADQQMQPLVKLAREAANIYYPTNKSVQLMLR